jgi:hypothetical protein
MAVFLRNNVRVLGRSISTKFNLKQMQNIIKGNTLNVKTELGIKKVIFSHYSDKYHKKFWATTGLEYNCKDVIL